MSAFYGYMYMCVCVCVGAKRKRKIYCLNKMKKKFVSTFFFIFYLFFLKSNVQHRNVT